MTSHTPVLSAKDPSNGAYAHYSTVPTNQAAILPASIPYTSGVVIPVALVAAVHALSNTVSGSAMPGVVTPAMGLPLPSLDAKPVGKTLLVYGGSSSVGNMAIQFEKAAGLYVSFFIYLFSLPLCRAFAVFQALSTNQYSSKHTN